MRLDAQKLASWPIPERVHTYTAKRTILYAFGVGCRSDPLDHSELQFVYEDGLKAFPAMINVLGYPGFWLKEAGSAGVDWRRVFHGEQYVKIFSPLPSGGSVVGQSRILGVHDKGEGRDAVLITAREIYNHGDNQLLATVVQTAILHGNGGFGGSPCPASVLVSPPERAPDEIVKLATMPQAALIYRLSGDMNPLQADPSAVESAGLLRPILHGLCNLGVANRAVLRACYGGDPFRLRRFGSVSPRSFIPARPCARRSGAMLSARSVTNGLSHKLSTHMCVLRCAHGAKQPPRIAGQSILQLKYRSQPIAMQVHGGEHIWILQRY